MPEQKRRLLQRLSCLIALHRITQKTLIYSVTQRTESFFIICWLSSYLVIFMVMQKPAHSFRLQQNVCSSLRVVNL